MKKIIRILGAATSLILMLSLTGCYYNEVLEMEEILLPNNDVSFAIDIQPIFNDDCASCHNGSLDPDLREDFSYIFLTVTDPDQVVPNDADGSELYQRLIGIGNIMPPSGALSNADIRLVKNWINQGALNN